MTEKRSRERLWFHYQVERELAARLASASQAERLKLYGPLYDELFRRVTDHPQLTDHGAAGSARARSIDEQLTNLAPWLQPSTTFLELGAGDCALSSAVAARVKQVIALDVSRAMGTASFPPNLRHLLTDGIRIELPSGSVDLAYSHQLIEHLHPDDAAAQLAEVHRVLRPGGVYLCVTPNRLTGPHDISGCFEDVATGFHLREYSTADLKHVLEAAGFECRSTVFQAARRRFQVPIETSLAAEAAFERLPRRVTRAALTRRPWRWLLNTVQVVAEKKSR